MAGSSRLLRSCVHRWAASVSIALATTVSTLCAPALCAPPAVALNPRDVDKAIDKAVEYLLSQQQKDGSWEVAGPKNALGGRGNHAWGGETAIVTYALMAAGKKPQDPAIKKAIEWLVNEDLHGTYAVGLRAQVWNLIDEKLRAQSRAIIDGRERDKEYVLWARGLRGPGKGFYSYQYGAAAGVSAGAGRMFAPLSHQGGTGGDRSNSQYGVLGAWALEQAGAEIPTSYWLEEDEAWKKDQNIDGGWTYGGGKTGESTATMTAAGLATLFITQDYVMRANGHMFDVCKGGTTNQYIEKGLVWMDKHAVAALNGGPYGLYGIERVGVASGRKYFGVHDWYRMGAERLVKIQQPGGGWGAFHDTCFCLLFLVRGRAPVMMNKLQYETAGSKQIDPWNERPRDCANLAKWMGKHSLEGYLNWQIVNLNVSVDELHDSPILYISGSQELLLSNQDIDKLRQYVEQGGMILGNADCNNKFFAQSFQKLGAKLFPKYEFRKLTASHPIFDEQYHAAKWKRHPTVMGLSNGIRELMILFPDSDPGKAWQIEATKTQEECFQLAGNVFLYAAGKENLSSKGDTYIVHAEGPAGKEFKLARIQAGENFDPEPGAWRRMAAVLHNTRKVDVKAEAIKLGEGKLAGFKIAHLTGTTRFKLGPAQEEELKDFVDKGGTLLIDAAGGSNDFADSAEAEIKQIWGEAGTKGMETPLPQTHLLYSTPGAQIEKFAYRTFARATLSGHSREPRIRGIQVGDKGRIGVFYSREDLTTGMVGQPIDGVIGYTAEVATQMVSNIVMYAYLGGIVVVPPPVTQPATKPATKPTSGPATRPTAAPVPPAVVSAPTTQPATAPAVAPAVPAVPAPVPAAPPAPVAPAPAAPTPAPAAPPAPVAPAPTVPAPAPAPAPVKK